MTFILSLENLGPKLKIHREVKRLPDTNATFRAQLLGEKNLGLDPAVPSISGISSKHLALLGHLADLRTRFPSLLFLLWTSLGELAGVVGIIPATEESELEWRRVPGPRRRV